MDTLEKNSGKKKTERLDLSPKMVDRTDWIDNQTYWYLMQLLELSPDESEEKFPWNIEILRNVFDSTVSILEEYGHAVCNPYVATSDTGRQYRCTLSECGCESCNCQDEFMEKERLLSNIEDAAARNGFKVMDGDKDRIVVRNSEMDMDFEIRVGQLAG
ncbi:hypothetical protein D7X48_17460 [bacterium D16-50]|nr:hypothetical protein D7X48_17460 [bacterium D16-50]